MTGSAAPDHGGRLADARRLFPGAPEPWLDLSTGINPVPYEVGALPASAWTRLPEDDDIRALEAAAASAYGVRAPELVVASPGTQILISLLPHLLRQDVVAVRGPTYAEHALAWKAAGSRVVEGEAEAVVLCNPNNPDGCRIPATDVLALARRSALVVVDEAFADGEDGISVAPHLPVPGLVVLRSFGKAYGLAGLRLGFALAEPETAARIRGALGPWAVSGPAVAIGTRALQDREWAREAAARLRRDVARLDALLAPHLALVGGTGLFRLYTGADAPALFTRLGRAGILVRRWAERPEWLRFGLPGTEADWARLSAALPAPR